MRKKVKLDDGRYINLVSNGRTPFLYKNTFRVDFFHDVAVLSKMNLKEPDLDIVYQMGWVMAKSADSSIGNLEEWIESFDNFPIVEIVEVLPSLVKNIYSSPQFKRRR